MLFNTKNYKSFFFEYFSNPLSMVWFCNQRQKQKRMKFNGEQSSSSSNEGNLNNTNSPSDDKSPEQEDREATLEAEGIHSPGPCPSQVGDNAQSQVQLTSESISGSGSGSGHGQTHSCTYGITSLPPTPSPVGISDLVLPAPSNSPLINEVTLMTGADNQAHHRQVLHSNENVNILNLDNHSILQSNFEGNHGFDMSFYSNGLLGNSEDEFGGIFGDFKWSQG